MRKTRVLSTLCPAKVKLVEYKVFENHRLPWKPDWRLKKETAEAIDVLLDEGVIYTVVTPQNNHNHKIVPQEGAFTTREMELLRKADNFIAGDANMASYLHTRAEVDGDVPANLMPQTIANKRRKMQQRKPGFEGDMKLLQDIIEREKENDPGALFVLDKDEEFGFLYQSSFMKHVMARYGNSMVYCDATHNACNVSDVPLFFLAVRTNCGFQPVAVIMTDDEQKVTIQKYLGLLREHNPGWKPQFVMCDNCGAEFGAWRKSFPAERGCGYAGVKCYICMWHLMRAWYRWISATKHGIPLDRREESFSLLKGVLYAMPWHTMQSKIKELKEKGHPNLVEYFVNNYEANIKMWAMNFRTKRLDPSDTNNCVESMNNMFKNLVLKGKGKTMAIPEAIKVLISDFLKRKREVYKRDNLSNLAKLETVNDGVPDFIADMSKLMWDHYKEEMKLREKYDNESEAKSTVSHVTSTVYNVISTHTPTRHRVNIAAPTCTCRSFRLTHWPCRHFFQLFEEGWVRWEDLPVEYTSCTLFNKDPVHSGSAPSVDPTLLLDEDEDFPPSDHEESEDVSLAKVVEEDQDTAVMDLKGDFKAAGNALISYALSSEFNSKGLEANEKLLEELAPILKKLKSVK